ncbi:MAG: carboxylating nicotinate-nucleotide diphosphorylase [Steroidobacteraceae bacterium]
MKPDAAEIRRQVAAALAEDIGGGDLTAALVPVDQQARAHVVAREDAVICGQAWFECAFRELDANTKFTWFCPEGGQVRADGRVATVQGQARALLSAERCALNFLQTLSGTATVTAKYVAAMDNDHCRLLDTRKTIPGLRHAQKYATKVGGAHNHRMGLYDMVLIKENHIMAAGGISQAVTLARRTAGAARIEVEVENLAELRNALAAEPDIIMLDEFSLAEMREAVALNRQRATPVPLEASGSIDLHNIAEVAATGVDYVSVGAITKHLRAIDLSMRFEFGGG